MTTTLPLALAGAQPQATPVRDFPDLVRAHQGMVYSLALRFLRDRGLAEDVAQEAFLRLSRRLDGIQSEDHLVFWLRQVTARLCIDEHRRRRSSVSLEAVQEPAADASHGDPWVSDRLRRQVAVLPEAQRMVVLLRFQEDLDPAEIARILGEPVNTVKSRLQRALAALRDQMGES